MIQNEIRFECPACGNPLTVPLCANTRDAVWCEDCHCKVIVTLTAVAQRDWKQPKRNNGVKRGS